MSKLKKHIEQSKKEYAEATPEGKRELKLFYSIAINLFMGVFFVPTLFLVPEEWILFPILANAILSFNLFISITEYNNMIAKKKPPDINDSSPQKSEMNNNTFDSDT